MRFGSVCSGIEAASVAWGPLGWECAFVSEVAPFPNALLAHRFPDVPNLGDMTKIGDDDLARVGAIDVLVGGTPCQSFSVAGLRKGLADPRGNLALVFLGLVDRARPRWVVWENVPGVLSSNGGRDFGAFLGALAELGYGWAYRVLDAQYFGLAQRRKRVFVVGHLGDWRRAAAVLLERESLSGNPPPRRTKGEGVAASLTRGADSSGRGGYAGRRREDDTNIVPDRRGSVLDGVVGALTAKGPDDYGAPAVDAGTIIPWPAEIAPTLNAHFGDKQGLEDQHALNGAGLFVPVLMSTGQANASVHVDRSSALDASGEQPIIVTHALRAEGFDASEDGTGRGTPLVPGYIHPRQIRNSQSSNQVGIKPDAAVADSLTSEGPGAVMVPIGFNARQIPESGENVVGPIDTRGDTQAVAFAQNQEGEVRTGDVANTLNQNGNASGRNAPLAFVEDEDGRQWKHAVGVRRLTPRETERLQGFPDDWTLVPYRSGMASDGPRYEAIGNSIAVPVLRWIGKRIEAVG